MAVHRSCSLGGDGVAGRGRAKSNARIDRIGRCGGRIFGDELPPQQFGDIAGAGAANDVGAMHLDGARAERQLAADRLFAMTRGDSIRYVTLAGRGSVASRTSASRYRFSATGCGQEVARAAAQDRRRFGDALMVGGHKGDEAGRAEIYSSSAAPSKRPGWHRWNSRVAPWSLRGLSRSVSASSQTSALAKLRPTRPPPIHSVREQAARSVGSGRIRWIGPPKTRICRRCRRRSALTSDKGSVMAPFRIGPVRIDLS